ncbi:MAG: hypothetical protein ACRENE_02690 [Polyangiaceae bacterium]
MTDDELSKRKPEESAAQEDADRGREGILHPTLRIEMDRLFREAVRACARYVGMERAAAPHLEMVARMTASAVADLLASLLLEHIDEKGAPLRGLPTRPASKSVARVLAPIFNWVAYSGNAPPDLVARVGVAAEADLVRGGKIPAWQLKLEAIFEIVPLFKAFPSDPAKAALYVLERLVETAPDLPEAFRRRDQSALDGATAAITKLQGQPPDRRLRIARWDEDGKRVRAGRSYRSAWAAAAMYSQAFRVPMNSRKSEAERE